MYSMETPDHRNLWPYTSALKIVCNFIYSYKDIQLQNETKYIPIILVQLFYTFDTVCGINNLE